MDARSRARLLPVMLLVVSASVGASLPQDTKGGAVTPSDHASAPDASSENYRDARAEKVLRAAINAQGGEAAILARKTVFVKRKITRFDHPKPTTGSLTVWFKRPMKIRQEVVYANKKQIRVFDGKRAWVDEGDGPKLLGALTGKMMQHGLLEIDSPLLYLKGGLRYLNLAKDPHGRMTQKISWRNEGYARDIMVDIATSRIVVIGEFDTPAGGISRMKLFDDYRPVQGLMVPFKQVVLRDDQKYSETEILDIKFNEPIDDSMFEFPGPAPTE